MDFWIGQMVWSSRPSVRNLEVIKVTDSNVYCKGESYTGSNNKGIKEGWYKVDSIEFYPIELRNIPFLTEENLYKKSEWDEVIHRQSNYHSSLSFMYHDYKKGILNLDPEYQRGLVWTLDQKQSYVMNLFLEKAVVAPTLILNWIVEENEKNSFEVLDGKQRLSTLFDFMDNKFPLANGKYFYDLSSDDTRYILRLDVRYTRIECICGRNLTLDEKIKLFLEVNELGTKMSDKHIEKVKELLGGR